MAFEEMWAEANFIDASIGGVDSVPEWEVEDYVCSLLIANTDEFKRKDDS